MQRIWCIAAISCAAILSAGCATMEMDEPVRRVILTNPLVTQYQSPPRSVLVPDAYRHKARADQERPQGIHTHGRRSSSRASGHGTGLANDHHKGFIVAAPLARMIITSPFGERRLRPARSGGGLRHHKGIDLRARVGTPVKAPRDGIVRSIRRSSGYGLVVELDHGSGWVSLFAHLSQARIHRGQRVHQGQMIALTGDSGNTTGPHLHWELRHEGRAVDPLKHLRR